jgi:prevent-host-death family protein
MLQKNLQTITISAMELRKQPGEILNQVFYRNKSIVVERAGEPMAVLMPVRDYEQYVQRKRQAKARFYELAQQISKGFSTLSSDELDTMIDEAVEEVRTANRTERV